jgi:putative hydrolase of the HAD superfamily
MPVFYSDILRRHSRPLEPVPTGQAPVLARLPEVRAVLFDLYGTLFISHIGEIGTSREAASESALADALQALGVRTTGPVGQEVRRFFDVIEALHAEAHQAGIDYPEVDIVDVWRQVVTDLTGRGLLEQRTWPRSQLERLAVEYEARANPVWPMPGLRECLEGLSGRGLLLGIISNGQFYTPELFPALLGCPAERCGFDAQLQYYSYRHGLAKPGPDLYRMAAQALGGRGVEPEGVLYVGNDMLNDILPARRVGFRTALFAGDARSLRLRQGDSRLDGVSPDVVLSRLSDLDEGLFG